MDLFHSTLTPRRLLLVLSLPPGRFAREVCPPVPWAGRGHGRTSPSCARSGSAGSSGTTGGSPERPELAEGEAVSTAASWWARPWSAPFYYSGVLVLLRTRPGALDDPRAVRGPLD